MFIFFFFSLTTCDLKDIYFYLDLERLLMILATAAAAIAAFCSLAFSWWRWDESGLGAGGFNPARRCSVPVVGEIEPLGGRGEGAGGFISIARWGVAAVTAAGFEGGEVRTVDLLLPAERVLDGGEGERDLDRES